MIDWIANNFPAFSGIAVALLSFLSSLRELLNEGNKGTKDIKKMKQCAEIYALLPNTSEAKINIDAVLKQLSEKILKRESRKINIPNIIAVVFIASVGGGLSYLLALVAIRFSGFFSVVCWVLFAIVAFFTVALSITGLASRYKESPKSNTNNKNT